MFNGRNVTQLDDNFNQNTYIIIYHRQKMLFNKNFTKNKTLSIILSYL